MPSRRRRACALALALAVALVAAPSSPQSLPDVGRDPYPTGTASASPPARGAASTPAPDADLGHARVAHDPLAPRASGRADEKLRLRYILEGIELRGNTRTATRVILRHVKFRPGDVIEVDDPDIELSRFRLLGTGFFSSVQLSLRKGTQRGAAILVLEVVERNTVVIEELRMGLAGERTRSGTRLKSPYAGVHVAETNLAGTGIALGAGLALGEDQFALRTRFVDPSLAGGDWAYSVSLLYADGRDFFGTQGVRYESPRLQLPPAPQFAPVGYERFGGSAGVARDLTVATRLALDYHLERIEAATPVSASQLRGGVREPIDFHIIDGASVLSRVRVTLTHDRRDKPFLTTRGWYASASLSGAHGAIGSDYALQKIELTGSRWWRLPFGHVVQLEGYAGAIAGDAPFFEQFYIGDLSDLLPARILDLTPDRRPAPNLLGTQIGEVRYGDVAAKVEVEYRVPLYTGRESVYGVDVFASAGVYALAGERELRDPPAAYRGLRRLPVDVTYNLGLRADTSVGGFSIAISNALGLVPGGGAAP